MWLLENMKFSKRLCLRIQIHDREKFMYFCIINKINFKQNFQNFMHQLDDIN